LRRSSVAIPALLATLLAGCNSLFFYPEHAIVDTPQRHGIEYQTIEFRAVDGVKLSAWFLPSHAADGGKAKGTVLFLHGNAENISTHFRNVAWLPAEGFNVLALDYRGYGASEGTPSVAGVQLDIDAAMRALLARPDVNPDRIVVFGQSLGGALAIAYVARSAYRAHIRAVVADSAFSDYRRIVRQKLAGTWFTWPLQWLPYLTVDNTYSPAASVRAVSPIPLLLIHGDQDAVVPYSHSQELFELAADPKELWIVPGAGHTLALANDSVRKRLVEYLERYAGP